MSPCKSDIPHLSIIRDKLGDKRYERECWFLYRIDINIEQLMSC